MTHSRIFDDDSSSEDDTSPCIGVCLVNSDGLCTGCFRTLSEIAAWSSASTPQRAAIKRDAIKRRVGQQDGPPPGTPG